MAKAVLADIPPAFVARMGTLSWAGWISLPGTPEVWLLTFGLVMEQGCLSTRPIPLGWCGAKRWL